MLVARLICSDEACADAFEARAATLAELDALACECGCALQVLGWPDAEEEPAEHVEVELLLVAA